MKGEKTSVNPYLTFEGDCREAMTFYKSALNAKLEVVPFEGSEMQVPDHYKNKVMHSHIKFGNAIIMASDALPDQKIPKGHNFHISIACTTVEEAEEYFNNLSEGGKITFPFQETFWGSQFGSCTDKFGINWMLNCELNK